MYDFSPIPNRTDDPNHVQNLIPTELEYDYDKQCLDHMSLVKFKEGEELAFVKNSFGYCVLLRNGIPTELYKPIIKGNQVGFIIEILFQNDHKCYKAKCTNAYFGTVVLNREYKMCRKHYDQHLRTGGIRKTINQALLSSDYNFGSDINGNFANVACRNAKHKTAYFIKVDLTDLAFVLKYRPRKLRNGILVDYKKLNGDRHPGRLHRVIYAKNRHPVGRYDSSLLSSYLALDHLNRDFMDQRRFNLKLITPMKNLENTARFDNLKAKGLFLGFGVNQLKNKEYKVKAYKLTPTGSFVIDQVKVCKRLIEGLYWKSQLEDADLARLGLTDQINEPTVYFTPAPIVFRKSSGGAA
jgi:hypothetical protein